MTRRPPEPPKKYPLPGVSRFGYAVAWPDGRDGDREIYVRELDLDGNAVGDDLQISDDATASLDPSLTRAGVGYGVVWTDDPTASTGEVDFARICP